MAPAAWWSPDRLLSAGRRSENDSAWRDYFRLVAGLAGVYRVFGGRAMFIHVGTCTHDHGGERFFVIIPGQKRMVAACVRARSRSATACAASSACPNNYLTLPVLFTMISNHYAATYGHPHIGRCRADRCGGRRHPPFFQPASQGRPAWHYPGLGAGCPVWFVGGRPAARAAAARARRGELQSRAWNRRLAASLPLARTDVSASRRRRRSVLHTPAEILKLPADLLQRSSPA